MDSKPSWSQSFGELSLNTISFTPTQKTASSTGDWMSAILFLLQGVVVILMGSTSDWTASFDGDDYAIAAAAL